MKRGSTLLFLFSAVLLALFVSCSPKDKTIDVSDDDPEMAAAIAKARETLPKFWEVFGRRKNGESDFALKVRIKHAHDAEHFWATDIERKDGRISGTIANIPNIVRSVKMGERIVIKEADITDWFYFRDKKMVGNYTLKVLFKQMPREEVERYKQIMADPD